METKTEPPDVEHRSEVAEDSHGVLDVLDRLQERDGVNLFGRPVGLDQIADDLDVIALVFRLGVLEGSGLASMPVTCVAVWASTAVP